MADRIKSIVEKVEENPEKKERKKQYVNPPVLLVMSRASKMLEPLTRRDKVAVVNFLLSHFGLNEPPSDGKTETTPAN